MPAPYLTLCRPWISLAAAAASAAGHLLASGGSVDGLDRTALGTFLLVCGASALNQWQERDIDALMKRTRRRPLPSGRLTPERALLVSLLLFAAGIASLATFPGAAAAGMAGALWYNAVYTPLKRVTLFAPLAGAPAGAAPVAVGWLAGGGSLADARLGALILLFCLWQVPHFWLLMLNNREDCRRAGLPSLLDRFPASRVERLAGVWLLATSAATVALPLYGIGRPLLVLPLACAAPAALLLLHGRPGAQFRVSTAYLFTLIGSLTVSTLAF